MPPAYKDAAALVGRILLSLVFVLAGFAKIGGFAGTVGYIASKGLPMPQVIAVLTILVELGGGLLIVFGFLTRWAALALAVFAALAAFIFHAFWSVPEAQRVTEQITFLKDLGLAGGMLVLATFGPGAWSVDRRRGAAA